MPAPRIFLYDSTLRDGQQTQGVDFSVGDKLARQIEVACGKASGWLDTASVAAQPTAAEQAFLELALAAYRSTNASGRKALREQLQAKVSASRQ